jgi:hypothetical protein
MVKMNECPVCGLNTNVRKVSGIVDSDTANVNGTTVGSTFYTDSQGKLRSGATIAPYKGTHQTRLAQKLSPPPQPSLPGEFEPFWNLVGKLIAIFPGIIFMGLITYLFAIYLSLLGSIVGLPVWGPVYLVGSFLAPRIGETAAIFISSVLSIIWVIALVYAWFKFNTFRTFIKFIGKPFVWMFNLWKMYLWFIFSNPFAIQKKQKETYRVELPLWQKVIQRWNTMYYCYIDDIVYVPGENTSASLDEYDNYLLSVLAK